MSNASFAWALDQVFSTAAVRARSLMMSSINSANGAPPSARAQNRAANWIPTASTSERVAVVVVVVAAVASSSGGGRGRGNLDRNAGGQDQGSQEQFYELTGHVPQECRNRPPHCPEVPISICVCLKSQVLRYFRGSGLKQSGG